MRYKGNQRRLHGILRCGVLITGFPTVWLMEGLGIVGRINPAWRSTHCLELTCSSGSSGIQDAYSGGLW